MKTYKINKYFSILTILFILFSSCTGQEDVSGDKWLKAAKPEDLGYSSEKLALAKEYTKSIKTAAVVIIVDGQILDEWGKVNKEYMTHSTRKSFMSALYGKYIKEGIIDISKSMEDLGIDDIPPLSDIENKASIHDCLKARSGIYHTALYESQGMKDLKPERHTKIPGEHWYYNNWDFNVLNTIFTKLTGKDFFETLENDIARPIGMEDFTAEDGWYVNGEESIHSAYPFKISARDMARFGLLMLNNGKWKGEQVIPAEWIEESTAYFSDAGLYHIDGYGYMWWVAKDGNEYPHLPGVELSEGTYSARGAGGHYILIIPQHNMVIVHRVNTFISGNSVSGSQMGTLVKMILDSKN